MDIPTNWTFQSNNIATNFDTHVREQLPWYDLATNAIAFLARHYIQPNTLTYDLGCSTGNIGRAIQTTLTQRNAQLIPIDESQEMLTQYNGPGQPINDKIQTHKYQPFSLAISLLALQFTPVSTRATTLETLTQTAQPGGAILLLEKWLPNTQDPDAETALYRLTLDAKLKAGATPQDIIAKELSLVGAQRPLDPKLLNNHPNATCFFRFGHFAGYVIPSKN